MYNKVIINIKPMGFMWDTVDPFLFCVHHHDRYPAGNDELGIPASLLKDRNLGQDFTLKEGWRMYHGESIPGFPAHPHRGFETVTIVLQGFVDHSDSHGAAGRYGEGDVQWMTAGSGLQHCEMFPMLNSENGNTLEIFQVWLNLPAKDKFAEPHFKMLWAEDIPVFKTRDVDGRAIEVIIVAGNIENIHAPDPAPDSWAADKANEVAIWRIAMQKEAIWKLPPASPGVRRMLYFYEGSGLKTAGLEIDPYHAVELHPDQEVLIENGLEDARLLLLQGVPQNEPVSQYGPFVMNTQEEIHQAVSDYRNTQFGGWPWPRHDHVHPRERGRFAKYANGNEETRSRD